MAKVLIESRAEVPPDLGPVCVVAAGGSEWFELGNVTALRLNDDGSYRVELTLASTARLVAAFDDEGRKIAG